MKCKYCNASIDKDDVFCKECGERIKNNKKSSKVVSYESNKDKKESKKGTAIASLVIGVFSIIGGLFFLPLPLVGLILGIVNKEKCNEKIAGIVLNSISLFISIVLYALLFGFIGSYTHDDLYDYDGLYDEVYPEYDDYDDVYIPEYDYEE